MADSRFIWSERARGRHLSASSSWRRANEERSESHQAVLGGRHQGKALGSWGSGKHSPGLVALNLGLDFYQRPILAMLSYQDLHISYPSVMRI